MLKEREQSVKGYAASFSSALIDWYLKIFRDLPWRETTDPYKIWLSEVILQQTRVAQGLPYYNAFVSRFPTVFDMASAPQEEVLRLWQGLGYYNRAKNMHSTAIHIVKVLEGKFPNNFAELIKLKGIGPYTAAAIASFAHKEKVPVVDGNVLRVLSRFLGIEEDISKPSTIQIIRQASSELIDPARPDIYNQAIMELGATVCTPLNPKCEGCPISKNCVANLTNQQKNIPYKKKKSKSRNRYFNYLVICHNDRLIMQKRKVKDIWQGLYDFPLLESESELFEEAILNHFSSQYPHLVVKEFIGTVYSAKHILSHQNLRVSFFVFKVDLSSGFVAEPCEEWYDGVQIESLPKPILIEKFLDLNLT
jgi:A/G-specific adenine glycosylase